VDVDDAIVLTLAMWVILCFLLVSTVDIFVTLLLIGLLVVMEICSGFIRPEIKQKLMPVVYFLLFVFAIIVVKKILEVLK